MSKRIILRWLTVVPTIIGTIISRDVDPDDEFDPDEPDSSSSSSDEEDEGAHQPDHGGRVLNMVASTNWTNWRDQLRDQMWDAFENYQYETDDDEE
ncbi:hypothetical protein FRX31_033166 [Thalictrum thalictroides]|uniref:Uncharacterized protein n=1 Tax=Thalictrum thalictroides TaxID=46969 RepID=A0A7J6UXB6_THATH|nr:hypothetical protein FRX31_033166 [Thalictrum thalictroides]